MAYRIQVEQDDGSGVQIEVPIEDSPTPGKKTISTGGTTQAFPVGSVFISVAR